MLEANERVMHWYGRAAKETKAGEEPVTVADREVDAFLVDGLSSAFPDDVILAEESGVRAAHPSAIGDQDATSRPSFDDSSKLRSSHHVSPRRWCVDPIDGTREFIEGIDEFAVMVGLAEEKTAVLGIVLLPARGLLYWGGPGIGAFRQVLPNGEAEVIRVSATSEPSRMTMAVSRSHRSEAVDEAAKKLGVTNEVRSGSVGVKLGMVASAQADLYLHPASGTRLWDACAPDALIRGAGGLMTDCRGRPIPYDARDPVNRSGLMASNGTCHFEIVDALASIADKEGL